MREKESPQVLELNTVLVQFSALELQSFSTLN